MKIEVLGHHPVSASGKLDAIQHALDKVGKSGRGQVVLLPGHHMSKPLRFPSNVDLHICEGAELYFSDDLSLYDAVYSRWEGVECWSLHPQIFMNECQNSSISGRGIIDGNGETWWHRYRQLRSKNGSDNSHPAFDDMRQRFLSLNADLPKASGGGGRETGFLRPPLLQMKHCTSCEVTGVTLRHSPFWNTHILYSQNISLRNLTVVNPSDSPNTDGINIDSSSDVQVEHCLLDVGDDCLGIKSGSDVDGRRVGKSSERIRISNCFMNYGHGAVVFGSEVSGGIQDVIVENCRFTSTDRGIRMKSRPGRGGFIKNILVSDIEMVGVHAPITINLQYRCGLSSAEIEDLTNGRQLFSASEHTCVSSIQIRDIRAIDANIAGVLLGTTESPILDLQIENYEYSICPSNNAFEPIMHYSGQEISGEDIWSQWTTNMQLNGVRRIG